MSLSMSLETRPTKKRWPKVLNSTNYRTDDLQRFFRAAWEHFGYDGSQTTTVVEWTKRQASGVYVNADYGKLCDPRILAARIAEHALLDPESRGDRPSDSSFFGHRILIKLPKDGPLDLDELAKRYSWGVSISRGIQRREIREVSRWRGDLEVRLVGQSAPRPITIHIGTKLGHYLDDLVARNGMAPDPRFAGVNASVIFRGGVSATLHIEPRYIKSMLHGIAQVINSVTDIQRRASLLRLQRKLRGHALRFRSNSPRQET